MFIGALDPVSNKATWTVQYELSDAETGDLIDLSDVDTITVSIRDPQTKTQLLSTTGTVVDTGVFSWTFTATQMGTLCAKAYEVGCTLTKDSETLQLLIGQLPVLDGIVS
jgi:ribosomal protein L30E